VPVDVELESGWIFGVGEEMNEVSLPVKIEASQAGNKLRVKVLLFE
jgi:hypothetical protein